MVGEAKWPLHVVMRACNKEGVEIAGMDIMQSIKGLQVFTHHSVATALQNDLSLYAALRQAESKGNNDHRQQFSKILVVFKKLHINIPFVDALQHMLSYAKFLNGILSKKMRLGDNEIITLTEGYSTILARKLP